MLVLFKLHKNEDLSESKSGASVFFRNEVILHLHGIIDVDANKWTVVCLIDNIRIPRRPWDESFLNMHSRLMREPSLEITKKHVKNCCRKTLKIKNALSIWIQEVICRLEGYQCQSEKLEELVELTERTHNFTLK